MPMNSPGNHDDQQRLKPRIVDLANRQIGSPEGLSGPEQQHDEKAAGKTQSLQRVSDMVSDTGDGRQERAGA
jgi:hypothetical protein